MEIKIITSTGPECSGKTELMKFLSAYFDEPFVPEFARPYLEERNGNYQEKDLLEIALLQHQKIKEAVGGAKKFVFADTDALVVEVWSKYRFGRVDEKISELWRSGNSTLYFLCFPDLKWQPDPLRESPDKNEREFLFDMYHQLLLSENQKFTKVAGDYNNREKKALFEISSLL